MDPATALLIVRLIDLVAAGVELASELTARKDEMIRRIETMIAEDRGPTDAEMDELIAESDAVTAEIRAALAAKG